MANVASMGPPPSPKEPRRSGRRSGPSTSTSKSPAGSPTSETGPKPKDNPQRPAPSSISSGRNKRAKNEDADDPADENQKTGANGTSNGRARRKADATLGDSNGQDDEEEEQGVTRCICQESGVDESEGGEFMAECEICHAWQHGTCMGAPQVRLLFLPLRERCVTMPELPRKHAKRARQSSAASHHAAANPSRTSRSHSPTYLLKQPTKRRNTMNSRDAAYDESLQAVIEASAAEAAAANAAAQGAASPAATTKSEQTTNGHAEPEPETENTNPPRRKRKRTDDDA
ncbi:hypothetical protein EIP86_007846 [Pleurotus ostreatoroseus]|nr:hypothetical protein EIP86_007846 [Pleurotus ostreatoroseus]